MVQLAGQFVPVKINAEKEGVAVAKKYGVQGFPTILFINVAGEVEGKIGGYMAPEGFSQQLSMIAQAHKDLPALQARVKANPSDAEAAARLAGVYAMQGKQDEAVKLLTQAEKADPKNAALPKAYNAVADSFQEAGKFDDAIPLFQKAVKAGKLPYDIAYAQISIATCYFQSSRPKQAIPALNALLAMPGAPKEYTDQAKQMLAAAKKGGQ